MLSETIKSKLEERFASPLPEFHSRRIVFWRDEDGEFAGDADGMAPEGVTLLRLTGANNFAVKKRLLADDPSGDYLIYDPLSYERDASDDWLLDIRLHSEEFRADLVSLQMEELLVEPSADMRAAVKELSRFLDSQDRRAKLRRIGRSYQEPFQLKTDAMAVLCGLSGGSMRDVIIAVLSRGLVKEDNAAYGAIAKFAGTDTFWTLVNQCTGYQDTRDRQLSELAAHILISALSHTMPASELCGLERFVCEPRKAYCHQLVHEWLTGPGREDLHAVCRRVEGMLDLAARFDGADTDTLLKCDTFPVIDEILLRRFFDATGANTIRAQAVISAAQGRRTTAWYQRSEDYYEVLLCMGRMEEFRLDHTGAFHAAEPAQLWKLYTSDAYVMDSLYRRFSLHFARALTSPNVLLDDGLKKCGTLVEGLYREWFLRELTENWTGLIAGNLETHGYVFGIAKQRDFYRQRVSTLKDRVFVVISDALRYEVAAELAQALNLSGSGKATIDAVQAVFPGVTKFGMAALLPGEEIAVNDVMEVLVDGRQTSDTRQRGRVLAAADPDSTALTSGDLLALNMAQRRELVKDKDVVYIYHNAIDAIGDKPATESGVFEACEAAVRELGALVKILVNELNVTNVLITADHGFLYTREPISESQKIVSRELSGEVFEAGRRYALASPDTAGEYFLPVRTKGQILGKAMKGFAPRGAVRIKLAGGGSNYVHGGVTLQEMAVPVVFFKNVRRASKSYVEVQSPGLVLVSESRKAHNLMFELRFLQALPVGGKVRASSYTMRFTDDKGAPVSDTRTVIADRTSARETDRVFQVIFTLRQMRFDSRKTYRLVIENGSDAPEEIAFSFDIAVSDETGFDL